MEMDYVMLLERFGSFGLLAYAFIQMNNNKTSRLGEIEKTQVQILENQKSIADAMERISNKLEVIR